MKVAIVGAGISGLSCAFELERNGITPTIFEKLNCIGDALGFSDILPRLFSRPHTDILHSIKKTYGISLTPLAPLKEVVTIGPNTRTVSKGKQGYIFRRGVEEYSIENQLAALLKAKIQFNTLIEIDGLDCEYDHVVIATANNYFAKELGNWTDSFVSYTRVATVLGDFNPSTAIMWLNTRFAKNSFAYLIPNSSKEASLVLIVNNISWQELDFYWHEFLIAEDIRFRILETRDAQHTCGFVNTFRLANTYFAGNAAGLTDNLIGIGVVNALESGIMAARSILYGLDYNRLVAPMYEDIVKLHELRKAMNTFDNKDLNRFVFFIGLPGVKQLIYNNPLLKIKQLAPIARLYNRTKYRHP